MKSNPLVSVITPAHNEENDLPDAIESILRQTYQNFEIIVINDGSTDSTRQIAEKYAARDKRIKILNYASGHSAAFARNRGIEQARGEIVTMHDADEVADRRYLDVLVGRFVREGLDGVANKVLAYPPKTFIAKCIKAQRSVTWDTNQGQSVPISKSTSVGIGTFSRAALKHLGGYSEKIFYFEDTDLVFRFHDAGFKAVYEPSAIEYHKDPATLGETLRQSRWFGKGVGLRLRQKGELKPLLVPIYCASLPLLLLASTAFPPLLPLFAIALLPLLAYGVKLSLASGDPVHSFCFLFLFILRNIVKLYWAARTFASGPAH